MECRRVIRNRLPQQITRRCVVDEALEIAVIPGDGIGKEVMPEGARVVAKAPDHISLWGSQFEAFLGRL